jgi:hypothetical protein
MKKQKPLLVICVVSLLCLTLLVNLSIHPNSAGIRIIPSLEKVKDALEDDEKRETKLPDITIIKKLFDFVKRNVPVNKF